MDQDDDSYNDDSVKDDSDDGDKYIATIKRRIEGKRQFRFGFFSYVLVSMLLKVCCCLSGPLQRKFPWWLKRVNNYKKFQVAK